MASTATSSSTSLISESSRDSKRSTVKWPTGVRSLISSKALYTCPSACNDARRTCGVHGERWRCGEHLNVCTRVQCTREAHRGRLDVGQLPAHVLEVLVVTKGREHAETAPKRSDARGADVLVRVVVTVRDHLWGEGARGAVVSTCMRAHACRGTGTRSHLIEDGREHVAHGLLVRSELLRIRRERLGGAKGRRRGELLGCTHTRRRRGEHFACTGMHRRAPCWARTWPFASLRRLPMLNRSAFWRALRSSLAMCASRSKAAIANSTAVWRMPRWLHCEHERALSVAAGERGGVPC
jgi:hypothetical protein